MIEIFSDYNLKDEVEDTTLYENIVYFIKLKEHDSRLIEREINSGQCAAFLDWHPNNQVGRIIFRDVAGFVDIFGKTFFLKTNKFLADLPGVDQTEYLLKEISEYSSSLVFSPAAPASFQYEINPKKLTSNLFYIYKYLSVNLFHDGKDSLQNLFDFILENPHSNQRTSRAYIPTFSARKFNYATFQRIAEKLRDSDLIEPRNALHNRPFIAKMPAMVTGEKLLPKELYSVTNIVSYDTPENRFLKYFLLWCQEIYLNIHSRFRQYKIREDCSKSLKIIRKYLFHPFFREIGTFSFFPTNSSVLSNRFGYKQIFLHYLKCRNQPKIFEDYLTDIFGTMGIKNLSTLYEYWVFFKIAEGLYGKEATLSVTGKQYENNILKYGLKISNGGSTLYYNKTFKHSPSESYNFSLRPDISLEITKDGKTRRYYFDAKFSNVLLPTGSDDPVVVYKNINVIKMLSYLEAISDSQFAVIVYPGTKFAFYSKVFVDGENFQSHPTLISEFNGVGALPLSPNHSESLQLFNIFMENFRTKIYNG